MKRALKSLAILAGAIALILVAGISRTIGWRPFIGPRVRPLTDRKFEVTPERRARGKYLTENLLDCFACHSQRPAEQLLAIDGRLGTDQLVHTYADQLGDR